jgi:hypothetical protein
MLVEDQELNKSTKTINNNNNNGSLLNNNHINILMVVSNDDASLVIQNQIIQMLVIRMILPVPHASAVDGKWEDCDLNKGIATLVCHSDGVQYDVKF